MAGFKCFILREIKFLVLPWIAGRIGRYIGEWIVFGSTAMWSAPPLAALWMVSLKGQGTWKGPAKAPLKAAHSILRGITLGFPVILGWSFFHKLSDQLSRFQTHFVKQCPGAHSNNQTCRTSRTGPWPKTRLFSFVPQVWYKYSTGVFPWLQ